MIDKTSWKFIGLIVLLHVVLYALFIRPEWIAELTAREARDAQQLLGRESATYAQNRAQDYYTRWFVNTGVQSATYKVFIPSSAEIQSSKGITTLGETLWPFMEERITAGWRLAFQVMVRVSTALMWWPLLLLAALPFLVDAYVERQIKRESFAITSPTAQTVAVRSIALVLVLGFLATFAPFYVPPVAMPFMVVITAASLWLGISQFVKRG